MTEPPPPMSRLVRLMSTGAPLDDLTDAQLIEAARSAKQARKDAEGRASWELHERGWTWEKIGQAFGVWQSTAHRWARDWRTKHPGQ